MPVAPGVVAVVMMAVMSVMSPVLMVPIAVPAMMMAVPVSMSAVRPHGRRKRERCSDEYALE
jgi:hypothetical protein